MAENLLDNARTAQAGLPKIPGNLDDALKMFWSFVKAARKYKKRWDMVDSTPYVQRVAKRLGVSEENVWEKVEKDGRNYRYATYLVEYLKNKLNQIFGYEEVGNVDNLINVYFPKLGREYNSRIAEKKNPNDKYSFLETAKLLNDVQETFNHAENMDMYVRQWDNPFKHQLDFFKDLKSQGRYKGSWEDYKKERQAPHLNAYYEDMEDLSKLYMELSGELNPHDMEVMFGKRFLLDPLVGIPVGNVDDFPMSDKWYRQYSDLGRE